MSVFRQGPRPEEKYLMVTNDLARDPKIKLRTKGVWLFMRSHSDGWSMTIERIAKTLGVSKDLVSDAVKELCAAGYIIRYRVTDLKGKLLRVEYLILSDPYPENQDMDLPAETGEKASVWPHPENKDPGFQDPGFRDAKEEQPKEDQSKKIKKEEEGGKVDSNHKDASADEAAPSSEISSDSIGEAFAAFRGATPTPAPAAGEVPTDWCSEDAPRCRDHAHIPAGEPVPACGPCGNVRRWFQAQAQAREDADRAEIDAHRAAVAACEWCDDRGLMNAHDTDGRPFALPCSHEGPPPVIPADSGHRELTSPEDRRKLIAAALGKGPKTGESGPPAPDESHREPFPQNHFSNR